MNLAGIVVPGERISAVPGKQVLYRNGTLYSELQPSTILAKELTASPPPPLPVAALAELRLF
jgi:ATP-dependent Lhr-like helicase